VLLNLQAPTPLEYFATLVQSDQGFPLLEVALSLAQDEYPQLDLQHTLALLDALQMRLQKRCGRQTSMLERIHLLNRLFYGELGFGVNANDYYDPDNSFVHLVLQTRRGIPISLGVLWLELARSIGLEAHGVAFPGHFMLKVLLSQGQVVLDPLTGRSFSSEELTVQLQNLLPRLSHLNEESVPLAMFLQSASPRETIARMLRNLKEIYRLQQDLPRLLAVQNRLVILLPQAWNEVRDRGWVHVDLHHTEAALADFQSYLEHVPQPLDAEDVRAQIQQLRTGI
jgi:regulator of sirC expression with transglutaminase-like and TPR domain